MHIYILGICGTFMGSLAILAREMGFQVSGCDDNVYPPMSTQLSDAGIRLDQGYKPEYLNPAPDLVVIGNAMSRGNPMVEHVLNTGLAYTSGPQFLHDHVIRDKWVLAVAGTHGKTTTASMLAWILEYAGMKPGFLIGGVLKNFPFSARIGDSVFFVVEADEYDTAFFDKRSKFLHYQPRTLIMNNLEYDHADIFENLDAIKKQFHHLLRIVPQNGKVVYCQDDKNLHDVITMGCWTPTVSFGTNADFQARLVTDDGGEFEVISNHHPADKSQLTIKWELTGLHNVNNALAALAAAEHVGVHPATAAEALCHFDGVKRRMEKYAEVAGITLYDDFAHHPTAIATTLAGIRAKVQGRVLAVLEPRSNTMKMGVHAETLAGSVALADKAFWFMSDNSSWQMKGDAGDIYTQLEPMLEAIVNEAKPGDHIVLMSNGGFQGLHGKLKKALEEKYA
jgi:UDP-N-acetylmuramate: L-alanyl-gamma-D-glutamyl-meso-diaminopimelate ligase